MKKKIADHKRKKTSAPIDIIPTLTFKQRNARILMTLALLFSDTISLLLAYGIARAIHTYLLKNPVFLNFWDVIALLFFFILLYFLHGLYPGVGLSPLEEIKKLLSATSLGFMLIILITFWDKSSSNYSRFILTTTWMIALVLVQSDRWLTRIIGRKLDFWGEPVAVVGAGPQSQQIEKFLQDRMRLGMRPVLIVDGSIDYEESVLASLHKSNISTVILVTSEMPAKLLTAFINSQRFGYYRKRGEKYIPRLILISSLGWVGSQGVKAHDLDGLLGLEVNQQLLNKWPNSFKRLIDLVLTFIFVIIFAPFLLLIMALIGLDSPGGIFYMQKRVGRDGQIFKMWKFRTMMADAEQKLQSLLDSNPSMRKEWKINQKLKNDPRITRIGKFLRKFSLDEIPQLINVVKGEMSLVGPRPYFPEQQKIYGEGLMLYHRVRPGMTGMWQIRGRNNTDFKERARLDEYYIRNWSIWLDIYILLRTTQVVISNEGAY
jgi:Undecaprenyl-phosphate galactose phosphotransferase WbaP